MTEYMQQSIVQLMEIFYNVSGCFYCDNNGDTRYLFSKENNVTSASSSPVFSSSTVSSWLSSWVFPTKKSEHVQMHNINSIMEGEPDKAPHSTDKKF